MKKLLCLTIVLALVAPVMAQEILCWPTVGNTLKSTSLVPSPYLYSRAMYHYPLVKFDLSGIASADDIVSATLKLHGNYMEDVSGWGSWQHEDPNDDVHDCYVKINRVLTPWSPNSNMLKSDIDAGTPWAGGGAFDMKYDGTGVDLSAVIADCPPVAYIGPPDVWFEGSYHTTADITQLVKDWVSGAVPDNGLSTVVHKWVDDQGVNCGGMQINWSPPGGAYGPPEGDNDGRPVISVIIPEPITLSLLSLGALALLRRRR